MKYFTSILLGLSLVACGDKTEDADEDGFTADVDCDDADSAVTSGTVYLADADGDGFGDLGSPLISCATEAPAGYVANTATPDCDDSSADVNPGADEVCSDAIDNDCDGLIDAADDSAETITVYLDADGDGYGSTASAKVCEVEDGWVENSDDCNDANADVNPGADEVCNDIDDDCDGDVDIDDDSVSGTFTVYADTDGDRFGDPDVSTEVCERTDGWVEDNTDCNDTHGAINPGADEVLGDGVDQDCDAQELCYEDADDDGFGSENHTLISDDGAGVFDCDATANASLNWSDCDDSSADVNPDATEVCDSGIDNDCDGLVDDADDSLDATTGSMFYADADGDGYGSAEVWACEQGANSTNMDDCDDSLASSNPMATDVVGDGTDQNCDGIDGTDGDGDGYASWESGGDDCADADSAINPGAQEVCDSGVDNDCDGLIDDEDDSNDTSNTTMLYADYDMDGFGDANEVFNSCDSVVEGWVADNTDCDDWDEFTYPGAAWAQSSTECLTDYDMDGWSATELNGGTTCYSIDMTDSFGDGWNGASVDVWEDSVLVHSFALDNINDDGSADSDEYCGTDGSAIEFSFTSGSYDYELDFVITDPDGTEIVTGDGSSLSDGDSLFTGTVFEGSGVAGADCDDWDADINPDAVEVCDGWDNNCDGDVDEDLLVELYPDWDGDGYGSDTAEWVCEDEEGYVEDWSDCDDSLASANPEATDIWGDGIDQNCDGVDGTDYDGDGFVSVESGGDDCDDWDATAFPGAAPLDDEFDCMKDTDGDGYGDAYFEYGWAGSDCEDEMADVNIDGTETYYDGIDGDCDWNSDFDWDMDGDDIDMIDCDGDGVAAETECDFDGDGELDFIGGGDCDDQDDAFNSWADEIWYDGIDQNCDGWNDFDADMDGDLPPEVDCGNDGFMDTECDFDGDGVMEFVGGSDCDDWDSGVSSLDLDGDGISGCDGDCWDSDEDEDGDGIADSSYTFPGAAYNEPNFEDCLTDMDGDGYAPADDGSMLPPETCFTFDMEDSWGDGWNGNGFFVYEDGSEVDFITLDSGDSDSADYCLSPGVMEFALIYEDGSFNSEVSFEITFTDSGDLFADGYGQGSNEIVFNGETFVDGETVFWTEVGFSGTDCDDEDAAIYPGADNDADSFLACIDDCDDYDADVNPNADIDGDGFFACGEDCDDNDANVYPGADEIYYNGMNESTCEEHNDYDWDGDGDWVMEIDCLGDGVFASECDWDGDGEPDWMGGTDCDDEDPSVNGLDEDWDGFSTCDFDCDDWDGDIYPGAMEIWYDGIDQDCAEDDDFDQDGDGLVNANYGGDDCDDFHANVGATDVDGDGYLACTDDCDDNDANINPDTAEIPLDGIDQDCNGADAVFSCLDYLNAGETADGPYELTDPVSGDVYVTWCDMSNGGWTLAFNADGSNGNYSSYDDLWWTPGQTADIFSPDDEGKTMAYDALPFTELRLTEDFGMSEVVADLSADPGAAASLLAVVANSPYHQGDPGDNDGSPEWDGGFKTFPTSSRTGSYFTEDYIKVWFGDTDSDSADRVVFAASSNGHGDWAGSDNAGAIGGEYRYASEDSGYYYQIWVR